MANNTTSDFVTLVSSDGFEFVISRSAACVSGTIRRMLDPASKFSEALTGRCNLETLRYVLTWHFPHSSTSPSKQLTPNPDAVASSSKKVCEYFLYNEKHKDQTNVPDMDVPPELCLELLMAADYLDT
ncbi:uncharacterized protein N7443_000249 [Penicillium atrosanguineum]|uniref:uncharacterized protein n=1 Tax=Penicillium atrosanguineum TaxID=1132637 RepID=UPI002387C589|nr:uncharacterized protein N7443_000249 [Penicillium atrosanguineum]KAJ5313365.1 hypothetical protein N7443_000249 [Penicillium atrosanguineum]